MPAAKDSELLSAFVLPTDINNLLRLSVIRAKGNADKSNSDQQLKQGEPGLIFWFCQLHFFFTGCISADVYSSEPVVHVYRNGFTLPISDNHTPTVSDIPSAVKPCPFIVECHLAQIDC